MRTQSELNNRRENRAHNLSASILGVYPRALTQPHELTMRAQSPWKQGAELKNGSDPFRVLINRQQAPGFAKGANLFSFRLLTTSG